MDGSEPHWDVKAWVQVETESGKTAIMAENDWWDVRRVAAVFEQVIEWHNAEDALETDATDEEHRVFLEDAVERERQLLWNMIHFLIYEDEYVFK